MYAVADWMSATWCGLSANLECRSEMFCTRLAGNAGHKKWRKIRRLGTIVQLCRAISSQLRHVSTIGKKLVKQQYLSTCSYNMVNFGLLAAEIVSLVWGTAANFNGFRVLAVTARQSSSGRQPHFAALNRGRHLYPAGRPSRWALAHILVSCPFFFSSPILSGRRLDVYHTSTHGVALVHHRTTLSSCIFTTKARIDNQRKTC